METVAFNKALAELQAELPQIHFDSTVKVQTRGGSTYSFDYATLSNVMNEIKPVMAKHGFAISQPFGVIDGKQVLRTILSHETGSIEGVTVLTSTGTSQERGAEISYFRRYGVVLILGLVADEDDDANTTDSADFTKQNKPNSPEPKRSGTDDTRPWLTEKQKNAAADRIVKGETAVYQQTLDAFKMKKEYRAELEDAFKYASNLEKN